MTGKECCAANPTQSGSAVSERRESPFFAKDALRRAWPETVVREMVPLSAREKLVAWTAQPRTSSEPFSHEHQREHCLRDVPREPGARRFPAALHIRDVWRDRSVLSCGYPKGRSSLAVDSKGGSASLVGESRAGEASFGARDPHFTENGPATAKQTEGAVPWGLWHPMSFEFM